MSYIGNPIVSTDFPVDYFSGNGSATAFTLSVAPASVNSIDVQVSGVSQSPQTYSVSGTTLTFSAAPPTGSSNIVVRHLGIAGIPNTPSAASVTPAALSTPNAVYWDVNGNVGVGTTSPRSAGAGYKGITLDGSTSGFLDLNTNSTRVGTLYGAGNDLVLVNPTATGVMSFGTNGSERIRIDSSGNLLVGATSNTIAGVSCEFTVSGNQQYQSAIGCKTTQASGNAYMAVFAYGNTQVGTIISTTSTTAYNTSSDYRLKENIAPMQNALNVVQQLKPVTYNWKVDGASGQGFIAHELQEVIPDAVTGEKDAVNEDGTIKPQGIDTSFLVATLTAAIQEQQTMIEELKTKVAALEAK